MTAVALIPFSTRLPEENSAHIGRGLTLELSDWLGRHGLETLVLTSAQTEDDGEWRRLVSFADELTPEMVAEFVTGAGDHAEVTESNFSIAVSGVLEPLGPDAEDFRDGFRLSLTVTDVRAVFARVKHDAVCDAASFATAVPAAFKAVAGGLDLNETQDYAPGTGTLDVWLNVLITRALTMAAQVGAVPRDAKGLFAPALEAAMLDPTCTAVRDRLGELCHTLVIERGFEPIPAIKALETVMAKVGPDWKSHRVRGHLMLAAGEPNMAARAFCQLLEGRFEAPDPDHRSQAALLAGKAFNMASRHLEAQRVLGIAMQSEGLKVEAIVESAASSAALGETIVAERLWQRALELQPLSVAARLQLARHYRSRGDLEAAREHYTELVKIPGMPREAFGDAAEFFVSNQQSEEALKTAERYVEEYPGDAIAHVLHASALNARGRHKLALKALDRAEVCVGADNLEPQLKRQRRFATHPDSEQRLREFGKEAVDGDAQRAEAGLRKLVEQWPDFWEAHMFLAVALRRQNRFADARDVLLHLRENHELPGIDKELTGIFSRLEQPDKALEAAERAMKAQPEDATLITNYAAALLETGEIDQALMYARRAEMLMPDDERTRKLMELIKLHMRKRGLIKNLAAMGREVTSWFKRKPPEEPQS